MRIADAATGLALVLLLTWLLARGLGPSDPQTQAALQAIDHYSATQRALHRDVLRARAGLIKNYDAIVEHGAAMEQDWVALRENVEDPGARLLLASVHNDLREQEQLVERFKSGNALLQNSLSYFALFSSRLTRAQLDDQLMRSTENLTGEMLHLTLDTSDAVIKEVGLQLEAVATQCNRATCPEDVHGLLAHGRLLHVMLPEVDRTVAALVENDPRAAAGQLRDHLLVRERSVEAASVRFRFLLYGASLLLLLLLFKGEVQLRARARDLRRQVALEHAVTGVSATLIGGGARTATIVEAGLERLATTLGARRAYFYDDRSSSFCSWPPDMRQTEVMPAFKLARRLDRRPSAIVHVRASDANVCGVEAALLRKLDTAAWIGVVRGAEGSLGCFLGFDFGPGHGRHLPRQLTVLRTALDAICLAFEHEEAKSARRSLADQLAHARRMETIGAFASGIAHNFNNLIGAISGYAEMAQLGISRGEAARRHIDQIQRAAERGRSLVDGILDYGRRRPQTCEPVDLNALVAETRDMVHAALGGTHEVKVRNCPAHPFALIDPAQLQQVFLNLCRNSAQAMEDGGEVVIEIVTCELLEPLLHPHGPVAPGRYGVITVRDNGRGVPPESLRRMFEPFYSTKASGNGLGLATAREIVVDCGGAITIDSAVGQGTDAQVWLPLLDKVCLPAPVRELPGCIRGKGEQVLILIEEPQRRLSMEELVAALGYEAIGVPTPARLLEIVEQDSSGIDALYICMPEITPENYNMLSRIRERSLSIPCVLATGSAARLDPAGLATAGVDAIISCPPRPAELSLALQRCLSPPVSGDIDRSCGPLKSLHYVRHREPVETQSPRNRESR